MEHSTVKEKTNHILNSVQNCVITSSEGQTEMETKLISFAEAISRVKCKCTEDSTCFGCREIRELLYKLQRLDWVDLK